MDASRLARVADLITGNALSVGYRVGPSHIYFDPSGTLRVVGGDGLISEGTWRATEDSVCSTDKLGPAGKVFPEFSLKFLGVRWASRGAGMTPKMEKSNSN